MIRSLQSLLWPTAPQRPAAPASSRAANSTKSSATASFSAMFQPAAKAGPVQTTPAPVAPPPATTGAKTANADLPRLGPMTADPNTHPAPPPPKPPDPITSSPWLPDGFQGDTNLMNRAQHENTMNAWLQNYTKWSNDQKTQIYQQAM